MASQCHFSLGRIIENLPACLFLPAESRTGCTCLDLSTASSDLRASMGFEAAWSQFRFFDGFAMRLSLDDEMEWRALFSLGIHESSRSFDDIVATSKPLTCK